VSNHLTVVQVLPALHSGGVERGTLEVGKFLSEQGHRSMVISAGGRLVTDLEREGSEHIDWDIGKKSLLTLKLIPKLRAFLVENNVDILHVRSRMPAWICYLAWITIPKKIRPKLITTVHGTYSVNGYSKIMTKGEHVIVVSKAIEDYVIQHYSVDTKKLVLNYRGVDHRILYYDYHPSHNWIEQWKADFPESRNKQLLTLPARVTRWKGQQDFIHIIAKLSIRCPHIHGLVVGDTSTSKTDYLHSLKQLAIDLGVDDKISFVGHRSDLQDVMAISSIVMSLSTQPEAFGRISLEALSMGIPVIAYAHGGVAEQLDVLLPQGKVAVADIDAVVDLAEQWLVKPPKVAKHHPFQLQAMLETTLSVYENALNVDKQ